MYKEYGTKTSSVSFKPDVWSVMESERGDIPRSVIINRALRSYYGIEPVQA
ncbi:hypothetical protein MettiDRAFT_1235 [Methanolobus tindarius DSM 2278]|uniref:Uncharacterized protein n=1 Tax=Methanolobus tindarius DSM 2278 TaxID=1090322 RepID=W9DQV4_METTI|nr:hypothetical protein MettiDRAFT_1235 [Methanolobus tindarius DSM 2278]